jgi:hypothetical protein
MTLFIRKLINKSTRVHAHIHARTHTQKKKKKKKEEEEERKIGLCTSMMRYRRGSTRSKYTKRPNLGLPLAIRWSKVMAHWSYLGVLM